MSFVFICCSCGLLGIITSIFGYGLFTDGGGLNPMGAVINLLGVGVIVALDHVLFKE